ncbi:MAG: hypothetical protein CMG71_06310 [Candidatus Marinimicrobia bacterium]|nr:hypothetical protein [Candidatus Neomarinimicrobiota bacterium]|tara:strand:+ start:2370 stop:5204 length:2835 start_codon:yes stop_codon:yes gene_type:complete
MFRITSASLLFAIAIASAQPTAPTVTSISSTNDAGSYILGAEINITLNFSELVTLTDAQLEIVLETGETDRSIYISAFATAALSASATYKVRKGDETAALSVNSINMGATGGSPTIQDTAGNAMINFVPQANLEADRTILIDGVVPAAPTGLSAIAGNSNITLTWNANSETDFARYIVYGGEATAPTTPVDTIATILEVSAIISTLANDVKYYYRIRVEDVLGNISDFSQEVSATPFSRPVAGAIRDGVPGTEDVDWWSDRSSVTFNWDAFQDNGAVSYQVAVGTSLSDLGNTVDWMAVVDTSVTLTGLNLIEGFTYYLSTRGTDITAKSDTSTSDGITIDLTSPATGTVFDGSTTQGTDRTFLNSATEFRANWSGFTDVTSSGVASGIASLTYSLGTSSGDTNVVKPTTVNRQDSLTVEQLNLQEDSTYYFSLFATDSAGNSSSSSTSNGVTIDLTAPTTGEVIDITAYHFIIGDWSDRDWINFNTSLVAYWYGFSDSLSGIATYEVAVLDSQNTPINEWESPMTDSTKFIMGLEMEDARTYTIAVRTTDVAGNVIIKESDGITIDLTPPSFKSQSEDRILLSDTGNVDIIFSEDVASVEVSASALLADTVYYKSKLRGDTLSITTLPPFASLDSVIFTLTDVTDTRQLVTESIVVRFHTRMLGDYNDNLQIELSDIDSFAAAWPDVDFAPVTGEPPYYILNPDGVTDLRDALVFARMWRWSSESSDTTSIQLIQQGPSPILEISSDHISISLPIGTKSGKVEIQSQGPPVRLLNEEISEKGIFLSRESNAGNRIINFALFDKETAHKVKELTFSLEKSAIFKLGLSYSFYRSSGEIISSGTTSLFDTPIPISFALRQNFPNPFNSVTLIGYDLPKRSHVEITVYDLMGRSIRKLVDGEQAPGLHSVIWNGRDESGRPLGSGTFLLRMKSSSFTAVRKMLLLK